MAHILLTRRALLDLKRIRTYSTQTWGREVAQQYLADVEQTLNMPQENPRLLSYRPVPQASFFSYRVRQHFLICEMEGEVIYVVAVIHGSMDLPARLVELQPDLVREVASMRQQWQRKH